MYAVDLDALDETVAELLRGGEALDALLGEVSRRVAELHAAWVGAAAVAQSDAQERWESGFQAMRDGLAAMGAAGDLAGECYAGAAATNLRMWEQVS